MPELRKVYLDTCCLIDLVKTDIGVNLDSDRAKDVWYLKKLMEAHRDREVILFTSTLTIAECRHAGVNPVSDATKTAFTKLLLSGQYLNLVQVTPFIAQDARDLTWINGVSLKGADSIHVASALDRKCEELLTGNGRLTRLTNSEEWVRKFGISIKNSRDTDCLPARYKQETMNYGEQTIQ